jgi:hypothetical protein
MKKKGHDNYVENFFVLKSSDEFVPKATVHIIGDKVFVETEDESIMLSVEQAKQLTYFLNDRVVRPMIFDPVGDGGNDEY